MNIQRIIFFISLLTFASCAILPVMNPASHITKSYLNKKPAKVPTLTTEEAIKVQDEFVDELSKTLGPVVGYKAAFTSAQAREHFNVDEPVLGILLKKMLRREGGWIGTDYATRPVYEADLIVRVSDDKINFAQNAIEVLSSIDVIFTFLELPDLVYSEGSKLNGPALIAINAGARMGVIGPGIKISSVSHDIYKRLGDMTVKVYNEKAELISAGKGSDLMGNPLNVVLWIRDELRSRGRRLKKGDMLSLGSLTRPMTAKPGSAVLVVYEGLHPTELMNISLVFRDPDYPHSENRQ